MKPSALGNVGRGLSNQLAEVGKLFTSDTSDLSRRARHADGCINIAGVVENWRSGRGVSNGQLDLPACTRYSDGGDYTAGKVEDWVANATAADLTFFIFDGADHPADLRHFAASVSGSSYWVLVIAG
jgi:hypothetical protein